MRRDRSTDLLQDILDFIDRIESWTPSDPELAAGADEKTLYAVLHALHVLTRLPALFDTHHTNLLPLYVCEANDCDADSALLDQYGCGRDHNSRWGKTNYRGSEVELSRRDFTVPQRLHPLFLGSRYMVDSPPINTWSLAAHPKAFSTRL